jgi:hypothetical protein
MKRLVKVIRVFRQNNIDAKQWGNLIKHKKVIMRIVKALFFERVIWVQRLNVVLKNVKA